MRSSPPSPSGGPAGSQASRLQNKFLSTLLYLSSLVFDPFPANSQCGFDTTDLSEADASWEGENAGDISGISLAGNSLIGAGDINGDGLADLLVGSRWNDAGGADAGQAYLIFGTDSPTTGVDLASADASFIGEAAGDQLGFGIAGVGDVNGDGFPDFALAAHLNDEGGTDAGQVYLFFGAEDGFAMDTDADEADASFIGEEAGDQAGYWVAGVGDANGDGFADFAIGAINNDDGGTNAGQVYLILGAEEGWALDTDLSTADASFWGENANDKAGYTLAGVGDLDGNGCDEILIGAPKNDAGGAEAGQSYLIFGATDGWTADVDLSNADASFIGENAGDEAGMALAGVGDVNRDGLDDFIIGAWGNDEEASDAGQTYLIFGAASGWAMDQDLSTADASFLGIAAGDWAGWAAAGGADYNGDGFDDIWIGARKSDAGGADAGEVYVVLGDDTGWAMDTSLCDADYAFIGETAGDAAGSGVACVGDFDGDGALGDFIIGAHLQDAAGTDAGKTYLVLGFNSQDTATYMREMPAGWTRKVDFSSARLSAQFQGGSSGMMSVTRSTDSGDLNQIPLEQHANIFWEFDLDERTNTQSVVELKYTDGEIDGLDEGNLMVFASDALDGKYYQLASHIDTARNILSATVTNYSLGTASCDCFFITMGKMNSDIRMPPGFVHETILNDQLTGVVDTAFAPDGRLFIATFDGKVYASKDDISLYTAQASNDLDDAFETDEIVNLGAERGIGGLISIALHPDFDLENSGEGNDNWIYLFYSGHPFTTGPFYRTGDPGFIPLDGPGGNPLVDFMRLTRYKLKYDTVETDKIVLDTGVSREILLSTGLDENDEVIDAPIEAPIAGRHNGGEIFFGLDGSLFVATGDGASPEWTDKEDAYDAPVPDYENIGAYRSQSVASLTGKILRINPETGEGYANNPYVPEGDDDDDDDDGPALTINQSKIWALGVRNPWRCAIRPGSSTETNPEASPADPGTIYIADVGWGRWEEINVCDEGGLNFGWPCYEGPEEQQGYCRAPTGKVSENYCSYWVEPGPGEDTCDFTNEEPLVAAPSEAVCEPLVGGVGQCICCGQAGCSCSLGNCPCDAGGCDCDTGGCCNCPSPEPNPLIFDCDTARFYSRILIGGEFYTGGLYPQVFDGLFFFADQMNGWIRTLRVDGSDNLIGEPMLFAENITRPVSFDTHPITGDLYYVSFNPFPQDAGLWGIHRFLFPVGIFTIQHDGRLIALLDHEGTFYVGDAEAIDFDNSSLDPGSDPGVIWSISASPTNVLASLYIDSGNNNALTMGFKGEELTTEPTSGLAFVVEDTAGGTLMAITESGDVWVKGSILPGIPFPLD